MVSRGLGGRLPYLPWLVLELPLSFSGRVLWPWRFLQEMLPEGFAIPRVFCSRARGRAATLALALEGN